MNSFIPRGRGNLSIVDGRASEKIIKSLEDLGLRVIKTRKNLEVYESIAYHPDIVIHPISHEKIIVSPSEYHYYLEALRGTGIQLIKGQKNLKDKYPQDICYNVGRIKDLALHRFDSTDPILKEELEKQGLTLIDIKQGYSKCSLGLAGDDLAITSDLPLHKKLEGLGLESLLIEAGHISLPGERYGFIGGAMGNLSEDEVLFSGSLNRHPSGEKILSFLEKHGKKAIFLSDDDIVDLGTILVFKV